MFLPLMAPSIFVARRIKEGGLSERSEFGSPPSPRQKSKEGVAISGAPFFAYVFGKTKKASEPRQGMKQGMHQEQKNTPAENEKGTDPKAHPLKKKK
ncbi:hypothetical protein [Ralstonia wenshanensis]|uniref:hypothetical protein n=1 Tax=Ralstonia wenshanensis TaxID=2842456 RepID=UPI0039C7010F